jgi:hypothetical protein
MKLAEMPAMVRFVDGGQACRPFFERVVNESSRFSRSAI